MLELYNYSNQKLCILKSDKKDVNGEASNIIVTSELFGLKEISFVLPLFSLINGEKILNHRWKYIENETKIKYTHEDGYDWYIIKGLDEQHENGLLKSNVQAKHISFGLTKKNTDKVFLDIVGNAGDLLATILKGSGWTIGVVDDFVEKNGDSKIRTLRFQSPTNTMDHLQQLSKLFEGYLRFNSDYTIDFLNELGSYKGVQFRYRKNLKSINRNINTNDIISKLSVEGGSDENGIVTISSVNPTKENHIFDFSYYINTGKMHISLQNKIPVYNTNITNKNVEILNKQTELFNKEKSLNIKKEQLLLRKQEMTVLTEGLDELNKKKAEETDQTIIDFYQELIDKYNQRLDGIIYGTTFQGLGDVSTTADSDIVKGTDTDFNIQIKKDDTIIINGVSKIVVSVESATSLKVNSVFTSNLSNLIFTITPLCYYQLLSETDTLQSGINVLKSQVTTLQTEKETLVNTFNIDLRDYINGGTYKNDNIIEPQKLYEDGLSVMADASQPKVSYQISIVDLGKITGHSADKFELGDIVDVIDEPLNIKIKARITKIERNLDNPLNTSIEISNFDTAFNDFLSKLSTASNTVEANKEFWSNANKSLNFNGTLKTESIQNSVEELRITKTNITGLDNELSTMKSQIQQTANFISLKASKTVTDTLGERINQAEIKITPTAITNTVTSSQTFQDALNDKVSTTTYNSYVIQTATSISNKVESIDYNGNTIASLINQTATTIDINASKINLNGAVTFSSFSSDTSDLINGKTNSNDVVTIINGTVTASYINALNGIILGSNATITWGTGGVNAPTATQVGALPSNTFIPTIPSYITSTKITQTTIESPTITAGSFNGGTIAIGSGNSIFKADSNGIYLGNATFASAPFRVSPSGSVVAESLTLTGTSSINWGSVETPTYGQIGGTKPPTNADNTSSYLSANTLTALNTINVGVQDTGISKSLYFNGNANISTYNPSGYGHTGLSISCEKLLLNSIYEIQGSTTFTGNIGFNGNIGFFGKIPTSQPSVASLSYGASSEEMRIKINGIMQHLENLGLFNLD